MDGFAPAISRAWMRTGNIRITGRLKEVINRGGVKFNPADIEALIDQHPSVLQCAIAPLPDPVMGERAAVLPC